MRKVKPLIITGILFSNIIFGSLPINTVNAATATPGDGAPSAGAVTNEENLKIEIYKDGKPLNLKATLKAEVEVGKELQVSDITLPNGYAFKDESAKYEVKKSENGTKYIEVALLQAVTVNYVDKDNKALNTEKLNFDVNTTANVDKNDDTLKKSLSTHNYELIDGNDYQIKNGELTLKVKVKDAQQPQVQTQQVTIEFVDKDGKAIKDLPSQTATVSKDATSITKDDVLKALKKGYKLADDKQTSIAIDPTTHKATVKVVKVKSTGSHVTKPQQPQTNKEVKTTVIFIDQETKNTVSKTTITAKDGAKQKLDLPKGYKLGKGAKDTITIDKNKSTVTVQVVKSQTAAARPFKGFVTIFAATKTVSLYDQDGNKVTYRGLHNNTDWQVDQTKMINGEMYYRVSNNEWLKSSDVYEYTPSSSVVMTTKGASKHLYDVDGNVSSTRGLKANTPWVTDKTKIINGEKMYRVSTNEWVKATDVQM